MQLTKSKLNKQKIFRAIALLPLVLFASEAWAVTCTVNTPSVTINAGTFTVQRDAVIGSSISNVITGPNNRLITCSSPKGDGAGLYLHSATGLSPAYPSNGTGGVFTTGLSGVGSVVGSDGSTNAGGTWPNRYLPADIASSVAVGGLGSISGPTSVIISGKNLFQLIKTDTSISSGVINTKIAEMQATSYNSANIIATIPVYITATINVLACSVSTPNVNVVLPTVNANSFTGVGNTLGDTSFTVGLQCDAGAKINATMNFTQDSDTADQSVAAVTGKGGAGIASGVGIQLLYGSTPLKNNTLTLLKTSSGGLELPAGAFSARYFQTQSTVQPGDANATATMTLTYQ